jgi:hypothetical protein
VGCRQHPTANSNIHRKKTNAIECTLTRLNPVAANGLRESTRQLAKRIAQVALLQPIWAVVAGEPGFGFQTCCAEVYPG